MGVSEAKSIMRNVGGLGIFALAALAMVGSCSLVIDKDRDQCESDADCSRFGVNGVCDLDQKVCTMCELARPPERSDVQSAGDLFSFTSVLVGHNYGDGLDGQLPDADALGYDLDGLCSTDARAMSCRPHAWASGTVQDFAEGRDNGNLRTIYKEADLLGFTPISTQNVTDSIRAGVVTPDGIVRVRDYSGKPFDDRLSVEFFVPTALVTTDGSDTPRWDGTDAWTVSPGSVAGGAQSDDPEQWESAFVTREAYVTSYTLVAKFEGPIVFNMVGVETQLVDAMLTGLLTQDPTTKQWSLTRTVLTGRFSVTTALSWLSKVVPPFMGLPSMCRNDSQYPILREMFCGAADTLMDGRVDPSSPCDGFTMAAGFTTLPARLAGIQAAPPPKPGTVCSAENDPAFDDCLAR